ncbi:hypothetical protein C8R44DRAFT_731248 [Mycena epipterygia]|nr:hypothetical protein C8R44DRAFT_731248 [Mycena epipterygia]
MITIATSEVRRSNPVQVKSSQVRRVVSWKYGSMCKILIEYRANMRDWFATTQRVTNEVPLSSAIRGVSAAASSNPEPQSPIATPPSKITTSNEFPARTTRNDTLVLSAPHVPKSPMPTSSLPPMESQIATPSNTIAAVGAPDAVSPFKKYLGPQYLQFLYFNSSTVSCKISIVGCKISIQSQSAQFEFAASSLHQSLTPDSPIEYVVCNDERAWLQCREFATPSPRPPSDHPSPPPVVAPAGGCSQSVYSGSTRPTYPGARPSAASSFGSSSAAASNVYCLSTSTWYSISYAALSETMPFTESFAQELIDNILDFLHDDRESLLSTSLSVGLNSDNFMNDLEPELLERVVEILSGTTVKEIFFIDQILEADITLLDRIRISPSSKILIQRYGGHGGRQILPHYAVVTNTAPIISFPHLPTTALGDLHTLRLRLSGPNSEQLLGWLQPLNLRLKTFDLEISHCFHDGWGQIASLNSFFKTDMGLSTFIFGSITKMCRSPAPPIVQLTSVRLRVYGRYTCVPMEAVTSALESLPHHLASLEAMKVDATAWPFKEDSGLDEDEIDVIKSCFQHWDETGVPRGGVTDRFEYQVDSWRAVQHLITLQILIMWQGRSASVGGEDACIVGGKGQVRGGEVASSRRARVEGGRAIPMSV